MKSRPKTALGIDIGQRRVSAALVEKSSQGLRIVAAAAADVIDAKSKRGRPPHVKALSSVLRRLGRRARASDIRTAVAVSTGSVIMRLLDLPKQMPSNVAEFVDGELKQYVALSGRSMSLDYCGVGVNSGARKRLLAVAADAADLGQAFKMCSAVGVAIDTIEPSSLAYSRAFLAGQMGARRAGDAVIALLDAYNLVVCLFRGGVLDFVRIRDIPTEMEDRDALCAWLTEELDAVVRYCHTGGSGDGAPRQVRLILHDVAYTRQDLAAGLAVESLEIVDCHESTGDAFEGGAGDPGRSPCAVAAGAAMRALNVDGDELRIDLTPQEVLYARASSTHVRITVGATAAIFLAIVGFSQLLSHTTDVMSQKIQKTRAAKRLHAVPAQVLEDRRLDREISEAEKELRVLQVVRETQEVDWPGVLDAIGRAAPEGACVTQIVCNGRERLSLKGLALSYERAKMFVRCLDGREPFDSVQLARWQAQCDGDVVEYEIDCVLSFGEREPHGDSKS